MNEISSQIKMATTGKQWYVGEDGCISIGEHADCVTYHSALNSIIVSTKEPSIKIYDVASGAMLQKSNLSGMNKCCLFSFCYKIFYCTTVLCQCHTFFETFNEKVCQRNCCFIFINFVIAQWKRPLSDQGNCGTIFKGVCFKAQSGCNGSFEIYKLTVLTTEVRTLEEQGRFSTALPYKHEHQVRSTAKYSYYS